MTRKTVLVIGNMPFTMLRFRGPLLAEMVARGHRVVVAVPPADLHEQAAFKRLGVELLTLDFDQGGMNPAAELRTAYRLYRLIGRTRPDLVFAVMVKPVLYAGLVARMAGVSEIYGLFTGLGYAFSTGTGTRRRAASWVVDKLCRFGLPRVRRIFFQNPDDLSDMQRRGYARDAEHFQLTPGTGIDLNEFATAPLPSQPSFLMLTRLLVDKGVREYVAAARIVRARYPQVKVRLAGWIYPNPNSIEPAELSSWMDGESIEFLGRLEPPQVLQALSECSVYVLPSYYREGVPRSVLEAMSMGRAVITTDSPGCRETVTDGWNGYLVPPRDAASLAAAMIRLVESPTLAGGMGRRGRERAEQRYDIRVINTQLIEAMAL